MFSPGNIVYHERRVLLSDLVPNIRNIYTYIYIYIYIFIFIYAEKKIPWENMSQNNIIVISYVCYDTYV